MQNSILCVVCALWTLLSFSQSQEEPYLLVADSLWPKEIFSFPIHFAKQINYSGFEDARFPPNWAKQDHLQYWSYTFAWAINSKEKPSKEVLQDNLRHYFDGLMNLVNKDKNITVSKTRVVLSPRIHGTGYKGEVTLYDAFHSKAMMTLNLLIEEHTCTQQEKHFVVFRFSPKEFDTAIWRDLSAIQLRGDYCDVSF